MHLLDPRVDFISILEVVVDAGLEMCHRDAEILGSVPRRIGAFGSLHDLSHIKARASQRGAAASPTVTKDDQRMGFMPQAFIDVPLSESAGT